MRYVLLLLIVALTSTAQAEPIEIGLRSTLAIGPVNAPHTLTVRVARADDPFNPVTFSISDITPADEGMVWTVNEANAATYGFDWTLFESYVASPIDIRVSHLLRSDGGTNPTGAIQEFCLPGHCILDFEVDRIDVTLHRFDILDSGQRLTDYSSVIHGTGRVVPEPTSPALVFSGVILLGSVWQVPWRRRWR